MSGLHLISSRNLHENLPMTGFLFLNASCQIGQARSETEMAFIVTVHYWFKSGEKERGGGERITPSQPKTFSKSRSSTYGKLFHNNLSILCSISIHLFTSLSHICLFSSSHTRTRKWDFSVSLKIISGNYNIYLGKYNYF